MNNTNYIFERILTFIAFYVLSVIDIFSQQWVVDDIAEENEGGPFTGIVGTLLLFGLIWFLGTIFDKNKKKKSNIESSHEAFSNDSVHDKYIEDDIEDDIDYGIDNLYEDRMFVSSTSTPSTTTALSLHDEEDASTPLENVTKPLNDEDFKERCIEIYGDYAEYTFGLILIKEDGDYRQISNPDKRYKILSSYLYEHHREHYCAVFSIGNAELLNYYIEYIKAFKIFPEARPMESHGKLEKEFYGERIVMMMAYYNQKQYPIYTSGGYSLRDYCLSLGWDLVIYIHRYIKQPMDWQDYYYLKDMMLHNMNKEDYLAYKNSDKANQIINKGEEGFFDGLGNRIGSSYEEARNVIKSRALITFEQAIEEVKIFEWHL